MGLAASQARLISLTSRQHAVEYNAQRLLNNKMQLSNESDGVYTKYMNALDSVTLTTKQFDNEGKISWIAGNINNLLRVHDDENTSGTTFFVQDIASGKLYIPHDIGTIFDNSTDMQDFVTTVTGGEVTYTSTDTNYYIEEEYQEALLNHWDTIMTQSQYDEYREALNMDIGARLVAKEAFTYTPRKSVGTYPMTTAADSQKFRLKLAAIYTSIYYLDSYSIEERDIIENLYNAIIAKKAELYDPEDTSNLENSALYCVLNQPEEGYSSEIIDALANYRATTNVPILNLGDAITNILTEAKEKNTYRDKFLSDHSLTLTDINNYKKYLERNLAHTYYVPHIVYESSDAQKAKHWEEVYKAIDSAGWTSVTDSQAKNETWTTNIIKSNLAILTTWDDEYEVLSKTATELSRDIREMSDANAIEHAEQVYEAEMAEINAKDANIDDQLTRLETERTTITTEVEGLKKVMSDNVDVNFKTFA